MGTVAPDRKKSLEFYFQNSKEKNISEKCESRRADRRWKKQEKGPVKPKRKNPAKVNR
jgi:hypothetical protein